MQRRGNESSFHLLHMSAGLFPGGASVHNPVGTRRVLVLAPSRSPRIARRCIIHHSLRCRSPACCSKPGPCPPTGWVKRDEEQCLRFRSSSHNSGRLCSTNTFKRLLCGRLPRLSMAASVPRGRVKPPSCLKTSKFNGEKGQSRYDTMHKWACKHGNLNIITGGMSFVPRI